MWSRASSPVDAIRMQEIRCPEIKANVTVVRGDGERHRAIGAGAGNDVAPIIGTLSIGNRLTVSRNKLISMLHKLY